MRNAALVLGIIAGIWGMFVGFFGYGYTELIERFGELPDLAEQVEHPKRIRAFALIAPLLALAGGAMARSVAQVGGILLLASAAGMYFAFGYGVFTMFPIALAGLGGLLAIAAVKPDAIDRR
ncbi:hypothetical protein [Aliiroseovarius crassostreae]|uniref:hypothetical protein n=1 Tax=Aliiroseovarius crassostreae TaxID=154981 RepID=UPI0021FF921A|nr:hypothetical protein [Aliiroseovarius crassostreae]UWP99400.1 hypothetical protein K3X53_04430 [Aliiroseovarius crassostreae]